MRRAFILLLVIAKALTAVSQVSMTVEVPPSGVLLKSQLWNILVMNSAGVSMSATLGLTVTDVVSSQQVMTAVSAPFTLASGNDQLQSTNLSLTYDYLSSMVTDQDPNGFMPAGNFEVCYTLTAGVHQSQPLEECISLAVEPVNPPVLNLPADGDVSNNTTPQFTWLPPTPLNLFDNLTYNLTLVAVQNGQTPAEALQQDAPILVNNNNSDTYCNYPAASQPLDTGQLYAWQVIAMNDNEYSCQSDIWTFTVKPDSVATVIPDLHPFVKLQQQLNGSASVCQGELHFEYDNEAGDSTVYYAITSLNDADLGDTLAVDSITISFAENLVTVPLPSNIFTNQGVYLFELENSRNEIWAVKFLYENPADTNEQ